MRLRSHVNQMGNVRQKYVLYSTKDIVSSEFFQ